MFIILKYWQKYLNTRSTKKYFKYLVLEVLCPILLNILCRFRSEKIKKNIHIYNWQLYSDFSDSKNRSVIRLFFFISLTESSYVGSHWNSFNFSFFLFHELLSWWYTFGDKQARGDISVIERVSYIRHLEFWLLSFLLCYSTDYFDPRLYNCGKPKKRNKEWWVKKTDWKPRNPYYFRVEAGEGKC